MDREMQIKAFMDTMSKSRPKQRNPKVGFFWFDVGTRKLFGVHTEIADGLKAYKSPEFDNKLVKTSDLLHEEFWDEKVRFDEDPKFKGDYTKVPRGRIFQVEDNFVITVGDWIKDYPEVIDLVIERFDLPKDKTTSQVAYHWNIGSGWSDKYI